MGLDSAQSPPIYYVLELAFKRPIPPDPSRMDLYAPLKNLPLQALLFLVQYPRPRKNDTPAAFHTPKASSGAPSIYLDRQSSQKMSKKTQTPRACIAIP
jgi:hypothetical protein